MIEKETFLKGSGVVFRFNKVSALALESINKIVGDPFACFSDYYAHYIKKHFTLLQFTLLCAGICYYFRAWLLFHSSSTKMNLSTGVHGAAHTWGKSHWLSLYPQFFLFFFSSFKYPVLVARMGIMVDVYRVDITVLKSLLSRLSYLFIKLEPSPELDGFLRS